MIQLLELLSKRELVCDHPSDVPLAIAMGEEIGKDS